MHERPAFPTAITATAPTTSWRWRSGGALWQRIWPRVVCLLVLLGTVVVLAPLPPAPEADITAAAAARASLRYDRALAFYAAASAHAPADPQPLCLAGEVSTLQQEWDAAVQAYRRCLALTPDDAGAAWLALGVALAAQSNSAAAEQAWQRATTHGQPRAWQHLGLLHEQQSRFDVAQQDWSHLPTSDAQAQEHLGLLALWRGDVIAARRAFAHVLQQPGAASGEITANGFTVLADTAAQDGATLAQLGTAYLRIGLPTLALRSLRAAVAADPLNGSAHASLGWTLWLLGERVSAQPEIANALRLNPRLSFAWFAAGEIARADPAPTQQAQARADFEQGIQLNASNPVLWSELGRVALAQHDYYAAETALKNAALLARDPAYTIEWIQLYVDIGLGVADDHARHAALDAIARFPTNAALRFLLARVYDAQGKEDAAYYAARDALTFDPTNPAPYILLGGYAERQGQYISAALYLRTALALRPHGPLAVTARALLAPIASVQA